MKTLEKDNITGVNEEGKFANSPVNFLTSSSLTGNQVFNSSDEKLGELKDLMINIHDGKIDYAVIEFGGFLGIGEKYFAVPFNALILDTVRHAFILNQPREVLEKAPGFDKDHWPHTNSHEMKQTSTYWGGFTGPSTGSEY